MYIFKQPLIGGEVGCHQDSTFLYTDPMTVTGFWFAIEDATLQNGCLWAKPGGHRTTLRKLFKRAGDSRRRRHGVRGARSRAAAVAVRARAARGAAGTMVILHGLLPHWSDINRSDEPPRLLAALHLRRGRLPEWNWLRRSPDMPLRSLAGVAA